ncbi:hypothetical protein ACFL13_02365 [Patescibacteria group bacterium]
MKSSLRMYLLMYLSVRITQYVIGGFSFGDPSAFLLYVLGLSVLHFFLRPLLKFVSLPTKKTGFLFMSFLLTLIATYIFTLFIPYFGIQDTLVSELIIFGFVLPSKHLEALWGMVFSSLLITVLMWFFNWLCEGKRKY